MRDYLAPPKLRQFVDLREYPPCSRFPAWTTIVRTSHDCIAQYQLAVQPDGGGAAVVADILTSYGDLGRKLSLHLDGFTPDGKRVFGSMSESGRAPDSTLFDYHTADGKVQLFDIAKARRQIPASKCGTEVAVSGTTDAGDIVIGPDPRASVQTGGCSTPLPQCCASSRKARL